MRWCSPFTPHACRGKATHPMFEKALITRVGNGDVDLGLIAETLLFYDKTHLLLNRGAIHALALWFSPEDMRAFMQRSGVRLSYFQSNFGVITSGPLQAHAFTAFALGSKTRKNLHY